jgi:hypothetical protein
VVYLFVLIHLSASLALTLVRIPGFLRVPGYSSPRFCLLISTTRIPDRSVFIHPLRLCYNRARPIMLLQSVSGSSFPKVICSLYSPVHFTSFFPQEGRPSLQVLGCFSSQKCAAFTTGVNQKEEAPIHHSRPVHHQHLVHLK